jgi:hypothetical protein
MWFEPGKGEERISRAGLSDDDVVGYELRFLQLLSEVR